MVWGVAAAALRITAIVCAYNEAQFLSACLHSLLAQTRPPDEIIVVDNASTDDTAAVASAVNGVLVIREPRRGLVVAREAARRAAHGDLLAYVDADCRVPLKWLERVERRFIRHRALVAVTGPYRFFDWDVVGCTLIRAYDYVVAPPTHLLVHYGLGAGAILYGGNFAVRREALERIEGFDRVSRRRHESRSASDAARRCRDRSRVLGVDLRPALSRHGQAEGVRTVRA